MDIWQKCQRQGLACPPYLTSFYKTESVPSLNTLKRGGRKYSPALFCQRKKVYYERDFIRFKQNRSIVLIS